MWMFHVQPNVMYDASIRMGWGDAVGEKTLCPGLVYYLKNKILADRGLAQLQARKSVSCSFVYIW